MTARGQYTSAETRPSLIAEAEGFVSGVADVMRKAKTEEDLRIGVEKLLDPILQQIDITPTYEHFGQRTVFRGRPDAVHGQLIIEYEPPECFSSQRAIKHAQEQLIEYMKAAVGAPESDTRDQLQRLMGVGFDGRHIFFVRYSPVNEESSEPFARIGPYAFDAESARTFLTHLRALSRLPMTADHLNTQFGRGSRVAPLVVSALTDALQNWGGTRSKVFFDEWKRLFGIVYGEQFADQRGGKGMALAELYGVGNDIGFQELLFCVHTFFALLMKFIAAEIVTLNESSFATSFSQRLTHASKEAFSAQLQDIEDGGVYSKRGITNFLEGDFFRWYLDSMSPRLEEAIREMARALAAFEPATTSIDPKSSRDLLKKLYQYLVPQEVRHDLGEYYTPDWLAELVLNEVGYNGDTKKRLLDPACGSGTFLVLAIQRARQHGTASKETSLRTAKHIVANIWGFDLNPLAVIAARTNFLFAMGDLATKLESFEIPIYLADSVLWPERSGQAMIGPYGEVMPVSTSVREEPFFVPRIWVHDEGFLMRRAAPIIEKLIKDGFSADEALPHLKREGLAFPPHEKVVKSFYAVLAQLEKEGKNGIWARFLKNVFAPMLAKRRFDFVVGNPPWIRWGYLSQKYRDATLPMWKSYGLFSLKGHAARLGGGEKDFSMLFTYAAADYYLMQDAKLGFLITQEVFKSKGAGEGFRRFRLGERDYLKVLKAHDLVSVQPFEKAANKTAAIILRKGSKTKAPVPYVLWKRKKGIGRIPTDIPLAEALPLLKKQNLLATPMGSPTGSWQTLSQAQLPLKALQGDNAYQARQGADTQPYGVFLLQVTQVLANGNILVRNIASAGKRKVPLVEQEQIEPDLVFPAIRGADIERWKATPRIFTLLTQDPDKREPYSERRMKHEWPRTFGYLTRFKEILLSRASKSIRELAERTAFYAMFGIGEYTVARWKVVWQLMSQDLVAAVVSQQSTDFGFKTVIPIKTVALIACDNEAEAHYLCALLNSAPVRDFVKSYSSAGRGFGTPSVMKHIAIPQFDGKLPLHKKLLQLSQHLHESKEKDDLDAVEEMEQELDEVASAFFGI